MSEGITYNPNGTVTVTFDSTAYLLRRPTFGQFRYFNRKFYAILDDINGKLADAREMLESEDEKTQAQGRALTKEIGEKPLHEYTSQVLQEMFTQCGDALPEKIDDWPAWLVTDPTLMRTILDHWRTTPKASGTATEAAESG